MIFNFDFNYNYFLTLNLLLYIKIKEFTKIAISILKINLKNIY